MDYSSQTHIKDDDHPNQTFINGLSKPSIYKRGLSKPNIYKEDYPNQT